MKPTVSVRFHLPKLLYNQLSVMAITQDQTLTEYINTVLAQHVADNAHLVTGLFAND